MDVWQLYWIIKLDSIRSFLDGLATSICAIGGICVVVFFVSLIVYAINRADGDDSATDAALAFSKRMRPFSFTILPIGILIFFFHALIPSTKQMAAIVVIPQVVNAVSASETIQKLPGKILNLADEWVNELSPKKSDETKWSN